MDYEIYKEIAKNTFFLHGRMADMIVDLGT